MAISSYTGILDWNIGNPAVVSQGDGRGIIR